MRNADGINRIPTATHSGYGNLRSYAVLPCPFGCSFGNPSDFYNSVAPSIVRLRNAVAPLAILFTVIAIHLLSIDGMINGGRKPHVFEKVFKDFPTSIERDASSAVIFESVIGLVAAAPTEVNPSLPAPLMDWVVGMRHPVSFIDGGTTHRASAANDIAAFYMISNCDFFHFRSRI